MSSLAANIIVSTSPEEIIHGIVGVTTIVTGVNITNPAAVAWTVGLYYTRGTVRTCLFKYNLNDGDTVEGKGPYTLLSTDNLEIETDIGVEVTFQITKTP